MMNLLVISLIQKEELMLKHGRTLHEKDDRILDIRHMNLANGKQSTVVLRSSGQVDLYWNCKFVACSDEASV